MQSLAFAFAFGSLFESDATSGTISATFPTAVAALSGNEDFAQGSLQATFPTPSTSLTGTFFIPTQVSQVVDWWRADLGITIATGVSQWADQVATSPINLAQGTTSRQPTHTTNGGPKAGCDSIDFASASTQFLTSAAKHLNASPYTIWAVVKSSSSGGMWYYVGDDNAGNGMGIQRTASRVVYESGAAVLSDGSATNNWEVWEISNNGTTTTLRVNGASQSLTNSTTQPLAPSTVTTVGAGNGSGIAPLNGSVSELIFANSASSSLNATDLSNIRTYLTARTGIAA